MMMSDDYQDRPRRPLRETVCDIDKDILRLLLRRHNLLQRMAGEKNRISPQEERFIRESWEDRVGKVSSDPNLSSRFFMLMQDVKFHEQPEAGTAAKIACFGLTPKQEPVSVHLAGPKDQKLARVWCSMAAASGKALRLTQIPMSDTMYSCIKMFNQLNSSLIREKDQNTISAVQGTPAEAVDKVIHVGDSAFNFYLALAFYVGRPSHAKFSGDTNVKLADFTLLRSFLPALNARLISLVPQSTGLPMRLECAGILPAAVTIPADIPADFLLALLISAPFYQQAITFDLSEYPADKTSAALSLALPILTQSACMFTQREDRIYVEPNARIPQTPYVPIDAEMAAMLLGFCAVNGGSVRLEGLWADNEATRAVESFYTLLGLTVSKSYDYVKAASDDGYTFTKDRLSVPEGLPADLIPVPCAMACIQALKYGRALIPSGCPSDPDFMETLNSFAAACGLLLSDEQVLELRHDDEEEHGSPAWTAPSAQWGYALALAAMARPQNARGFRLNNPNIVTSSYPAFWTMYNALPSLDQETTAQVMMEEQKHVRRRIKTHTAARLTPRPEDD